nr:uroporphyrinogen-III synthase [Bacillus canaveralius]
MLKRLEGKKIALAGTRKTEEISRIIENLGGIPLVRPAQGTVYLDDSNIEKDINELVKGKYDWFIFTTGLGTETLYKIAEGMGLENEFVDAIRQARVAARGYKTVNALKRLGITPVARDDDGSTAGLVRSLQTHNLKRSRVALQLHGDPAPQLIHFLEEQEAGYKEILPYHHVPPNPEIINQLINEILDAKIDAVNFTSTPQARFLFSHARDKGFLEDVLKAFASDVVAVAVGKVTAAALRDEGVERIIVPELERMGSAIIALENYYAKQ